jgi:hypothetical protein
MPGDHELTRRAAPRRLRSVVPAWAALCVATVLAVGGAGSAWALSEIQRGPGAEPAPSSPSNEQIDQQPLPPVDQVPLPDAASPSAPDEPAAPADPNSIEPGENGVPAQEAEPDGDPDEPVPEVQYDLSKLPEPVRRMHDLLLEACKSGDVEKLRPLIDTGENGTQLSFGGVDGDPIAYLKNLSADKEGREILAILEEVLTAGYVHMDPGSPNEMYVWPYFFAVPLDRLTPAQRVELFKIVTANEYEDMVTYGSYIFYRAGITPDGRWSFFVAGD